MQILKITLAVWMAVFLALPTCPCQLFESLGYDFPHKHAEGSLVNVNPDYDGHVDLVSMQGNTDENLPFCHCDDSVAKTAEKCEVEELLEPLLFQMPLSFDPLVLLVLHQEAFRLARAPPPTLLNPFSLDRSLTGVYRL